ncbi:hypothetical protein CK820_G0056427 [Pan troglodytes]|uniref:Uncharacterized protein n=1 Tax=Pan troglodytes TaxID=9598 RepID=A0A2J8IK67_PANTR|nr:hypothetical protein CK820_G0056427 [Pan troglodytes]
MWEAEAGPPQIGLSRPTCSLPASSRAQLFLPAVSPGLTLASQHPQASRWPLQAQLLPSDGKVGGLL